MVTIRKCQINNQLDEAERADDESDLAFVDPDHAKEDKEEENEETIMEKTVASPVEQRVEE